MNDSINDSINSNDSGELAMDLQQQDSDTSDINIQIDQTVSTQNNNAAGALSSSADDARETISALDALASTVLWGHLAPTCPGKKTTQF